MSAAEPSSFGAQLRRLREAAGLTQEELAERAGISVKAIGALERGRRQRPYPHTVRALADALGLSEAERAEFSGARTSRERATPESTPLAPLAPLPTPPTALIGREHELAEIAALVREAPSRLVTLTGPGGVGKTRLALEVAATFADELDGRVVFVGLASLAERALVLPEIARALGVPESGDSQARDAVVGTVGGDRWLLVLDNLEHVLDVAVEIAGLLAACPELRVLVTSRAPLRVRAEVEYPLRPLALPDLSQVPTPDDIGDVSSVRLFVERARAAVPSFALTQANCAAIAAICRRLDGLPLALELVAARVRALSPTELLARLDRLLPLLVGGSRDLPARQQTMRAAIDWSEALLQPREQIAFRRLAIFSGGWSLAGAEAVVGWGELDADEVVDLLATLVEQSLVVAEPSADGATRYRMLEPIRQFAADRAGAAGERVQLSARHLGWCLALAREAAEGLNGPEQQRWLDRLEREHDNLRAALGWALASVDSEPRTDGVRLAIALRRFWELRGHLSEGRRWLDQLLAAATDLPPDLQADARNAAGNFARDQGDFAAAARLHEAALAIRRDLGDRRAVAQSLTNLGNVRLATGDDAGASELYAEAIDLARAAGDAWIVANALRNLGIALGERGELDAAAERLEEALQLWERLGESASHARTLDALGVIRRQQGDHAAATRLHEESLALRRELGDQRGSAISLSNLGHVMRLAGDFAAAETLIEESLRVRRAIGDRGGAAIALGALADVARLAGDMDRAGALYREALALRRQLGIREGVVDCLRGLALVALAEGDAERAARLLGASAALGDPAATASEHAAALAAVRGQLPASTFDRAFSEGRALTPDDALALS